VLTSYLLANMSAATAISTFCDQDDYLAALKESGYTQLFLLQPGPFRARIIRIPLQRIRLMFIEEHLARVAFRTLAPSMIRIVLPPLRSSLVCRGTAADDRHLITHGAGNFFERIDGFSDHRDIVIPSRLLTEYVYAIVGTPLTVPVGARRWLPQPQALKSLSALHEAATRVTARRAMIPCNVQAVHGLEQELIDRLVECLSSARCEITGTGSDRGADVIARFAASVEAHAGQFGKIGEFCEAIGVAERELRRISQRHIGLSPRRYLLLYRMQLVNRSLRSRTSPSRSVSEVACRFGFWQMGRFAASYRELFGELPSATLHRSRADPAA
jgi:AraC-like DNA-binding protein